MVQETEGKDSSFQPEDVKDDSPQGGPLRILFAPDSVVWNEARRMIMDKSLRVTDFATIATQDPVLVIELLRKSNALFFAGGRSPITSVKTAIVRLGYDVVLEMLELLADRKPLEDEEARRWFEVFRNRCKRTSILAMILAESVARALSDDCQASAVLSSVGDMLAVSFFKERYVALAEEHSRSGTNYQLSHNLHFDVEEMGLRYLRKHGIPEALLFAIDREAQNRTPDRAVMRPICFGAIEMLEAFDANRWEKLAPGRTLAPKSSLRLLQMSDSQYLRVYERAAEYLFSARLEEERKRHEDLQRTLESSRALEVQSEPAEEDLCADIEMLMQGLPEEEVEEAPLEPLVDIPSFPAAQEEEHRDFPLVDGDDRFSLRKRPATHAARRESIGPAIEAPKLRTSYGTALVSSIADMFEKSANSEQLLLDLLEMLVKDRLFEKAALIVVSRDREYAIVVAARGPNIGNGQRLSLTDPLSPLARCFSKVQSYGNRSNPVSPFGSKAFALAPIDADHETPVALYADCGNEASVPFEARRVFRTVVDLLNSKLPTIKGGIPVELRNT